MHGKNECRFRGDVWYQNMIARRVREALQAREDRFLSEHASDADEVLIDYVKGCAEELGHIPFAVEVIGSELLVRRFGSWRAALARAELPEPSGQPPRPGERQHVRRELQLQQEAYRLERALKKEKKRRLCEERMRKAEQNRKNREESR